MGFSGLCRASGARSRDVPRAGARRRESQTGAGAKRRQGRPSRIRVSDTRERSKPRERLRIVRGAKPRALFSAFPRRRSLGEATQHQKTPGVSPGTVRPENAPSLGEAAQSRAGERITPQGARPNRETVCTYLLFRYARGRKKIVPLLRSSIFFFARQAPCSRMGFSGLCRASGARSRDVPRARARQSAGAPDRRAGRRRGQGGGRVRPARERSADRDVRRVSAFPIRGSEASRGSVSASSAARSLAPFSRRSRVAGASERRHNARKPRA